MENSQITDNKETVFAIEIVDVSKMPEHTRADVVRQVAEISSSGTNYNYRGFAKIVLVTASPTKIKSVEPIEGTAADYYKKSTEGIDISVF